MNTEVNKIFSLHFERLKHKSIVLYGVGPKTKEIIKKTSGFNFVGLLSNEKLDIGKEYFGIKVISLEDVIKLKAIVVIVAREELEQVILQEIYFLKKEYDVEIFSINGSISKLLPIQKFNSSWEVDEDKLIHMIENYDAVSFDIFETLISRRIEKPIDIFLVIDQKCKELYGKEFDFFYLRREAELSFHNSIKDPKLIEIYNVMSNIDLNFEQYKFEVLSLELEVEASFLFPRVGIITLYKKLLAAGKILFLITDTYLPKEFITGLLSAYGIDGYREIYISSIENENKVSSKLFKRVKKDFLGNILHIGDNLKSDIESARIAGFDTYHILSNRDYLLSSSMSNIINVGKSIGDRISIGLIADKLFSKVFVELNKTNGIPKISTFNDFGYIILGPLMLSYIAWLGKKCNTLGIEKVLFCAREGLLFKRLYEKVRLLHNHSEWPESEYFRASRRMALGSSIKNWNDIKNSFSRHRYFGLFSSLMSDRFNVTISSSDKFTNSHIDTVNNLDELLVMLSYYKEEILKQAELERSAFVKYIDTICDFKNTKIAISDQGSSGTVQMVIEKIIDTKNNLFGLYVCADQKKNPYSLKNFEGYLDPTTHKFLTSNHFFESIFTAPEGTYIKCNLDGSFVNGPKFSNQIEWASKEKIFSGIETYFSDYLEVDETLRFKGSQSNFSDKVFGLINDGKIIIDKEIKDTFYFDNMYVRKTENKILF